MFTEKRSCSANFALTSEKKLASWKLCIQTVINLVPPFHALTLTCLTPQNPQAGLGPSAQDLAGSCPLAIFFTETKCS